MSTSTAQSLAIRRGRPLTLREGLGAIVCGLLVALGAWLHSPWLAPLTLPVALLAPGHLVIAAIARATEAESEPFLRWALRLVTSAAVWTVVGTLLTVLRVDVRIAPMLVAAALAIRGGWAVSTRRTGRSGLTGLTGLTGLARREVLAGLAVIGVTLAAMVLAVGLSTAGAPSAPYLAMTMAPATGLTTDAAGSVRAQVVVQGHALVGDEPVRTALLQVRVDGTVLRSARIVVPVDGAVSVDVGGRWGRCWRRLVVTLSGPAAPLLPRPLTATGPGCGPGFG